MDLAWTGWSEAVLPPQRTKLGPWAGDPQDKTTPLPWRCKPFVDAATYGFVLYWGLRCTVTITSTDGQTLRIDGDYAAHSGTAQTIAQFAPGHYGIQTHYAFRFPPGWGGYILPSPDWFMSRTSTKPAILPGLLELDWWPNFFFVVSRAPGPGEQHCLRYGDALCQILPVPLRPDYQLRPMTVEERQAQSQAAQVTKLGYHTLATQSWQATNGQRFSNLYKVLAEQQQRAGAIDWAAHLQELTDGRTT